MGIVVDLVIIAILAVSIFYGYKKGLVKLSIKLCATIIALIVTAILYIPISNFIINTTSIDETIENYIYEKITETISTDKNSSDNYINKLEGQIVEDAKNNVLPQTARNLAINIVNIGVMVILFIILKIALRFITIIADTLAKLPIIKQFNKAGGVLYGIIMGFLIIFISLEIISIASTINPNNTLNYDINKSSIGKVLYNNNVIDIFLKR